MKEHALRIFAARLALALGLALCGLGAGTSLAQDDLFDFIPLGGRSLLEQAMGQGLPDALGAAIAAESGDAEAWKARIEAARQSPGIAELDAWQTETLASYLAAVAPLDATADLPRDGRDMILLHCQSCHIITVVVTQDRTREAWLRTMNSPSHTEIATSEAERVALADYLVINAGIPIDLIPPELRAGGASY